MRRGCIIIVFAILWLISSGRVSYTKVSRIVVKVSAKENGKSKWSGDFSGTRSEVELTPAQASPLQKPVEERQTLFFQFSVGQTISELCSKKEYSGSLLEVLAFKTYKLLFPFHHFW
jgi:hypothetical protein